MELPTRYPYNGTWRPFLSCFLIFVPGSALMAYKAVHNQAGLIIEGVIRLGPDGATIFYWVMAALAGMFVLLTLMLMLLRIINPCFLVLETDALLLPGTVFSRQPSRIFYADIQEFSEVQLYRRPFLYLSVYGRKFIISSGQFSNEASYVAVKDFLISQAQCRHK